MPLLIAAANRGESTPITIAWIETFLELTVPTIIFRGKLQGSESIRPHNQPQSPNIEPGPEETESGNTDKSQICPPELIGNLFGEGCKYTKTFFFGMTG